MSFNYNQQRGIANVKTESLIVEFDFKAYHCWCFAMLDSRFCYG